LNQLVEKDIKIQIRGHGLDTAKVMLIADGGTSHDLSAGYAITGDAEHKLRGFAKDNNLYIDEFWRTCLIKDKINNTSGAKAISENLALLTDEYKNILNDEIKAIKPNLLVPLGELSFNFITTLKGIRKYRGSILPSRADLGEANGPLRVIPILGPNPYLYEDVKMEFITRLDFSKIAKNYHEVGPIKEIGNCWVARSAENVRKFFSRHYSKAEFVVFDIETFVDIPTCISFCFDGEESMCVPLIDTEIPIDDRALMMYEVAKLLASPIPKINQNIKFDWKKLEKVGFYVNNICGDTMLAAGCLYSEFPKNLGFLTSIYTEMPYHKDEGKDFNPTNNKRDSLYLYCCKDSLSTNRIYKAQIEELKETGTEEVYNKLIEIMPIYKGMEQTGILIDNAVRCALRAKYENIYDIQLYKLKKLCGEAINPLSPKQCDRIVFDELKFKKLRGVTGTDEESLELLAWMGRSESITHGDYANEILHTIVACRKIHKTLEYLETPTHPDGRLRCEYNLSGTETGRTTAGKTTDYLLVYDGKKIKTVNIGRSFQTISKHGFTVEGLIYGKDLRSMFVPTPGYSFVECDLSGAEARVDAILAMDFDILPIFDSVVGIHRVTGSWVFNCDPTDIKKGLVFNSAGIGEDRYYISKRVRHAGERNMREDRLMLMIHKPQKECAEILKVFHEKQPKIREIFHYDITKAVREKRQLICPNGRRRDFYGRIDKHTINEAISVLPQAIVGDQLKFSFPETFRETKEYARLLVEAHDGCLNEVKIGREVKFAKIFKKNVEIPIDFRKCSLPREYDLIIPCETQWSKENWQNLEDLHL